jgi:hypothetical protein
MQHLPITFRSTRKKMATLLAGSLLFVAGGIWLMPQEPLIGWLCVVFFGLGVIVFAVNLHPKSSFLTLAHDGFTVASLFRKHFVPWSHVQEFVPARVGLNKMVGWNYTPEFQAQANLRRINVATSGVEGGLPDTYGMSAEALCALLNEVRVSHAKSAL